MAPGQDGRFPYRPRPPFCGICLHRPYRDRSVYVSHTQYEWGSILKFIEEVYDLPEIGPRAQGYTDTRAASLSDSFDFTQAPRPFTPFAAKYPASYFMHLPTADDQPVDDE